MQPSRRAFLMGRRPAQTPWAAFRQRLALTCQGEVLDLSTSTGHGLALLTPARAADVTSARALCAEYGVSLALDGTAAAIDDMSKPQLRVNPSLLTALTPMGGARPSFRVEPGACAGELALAGLTQFDHVAPTLTVAAWLAESHALPTGACALSGLLSVQVLFADGVEETLGPFGTLDTQPLRSATVQRLVPALFQLANSADAKICQASDVWPGSYRLDALLPQSPATVNLAHLLLGHGASLAWIDSMILEIPAFNTSPVDQTRNTISDTATNDIGEAAARLDFRIKSMFDVGGLFPGLR